MPAPIPTELAGAALRGVLLAACAALLLPVLRPGRARLTPRPTTQEEWLDGVLRALNGRPVGVITGAVFLDPAEARRADDAWFGFRRLEARRVDCLVVSLEDGRPLVALELDDGRPPVALAGTPLLRLRREEAADCLALRVRLEPHLG